MSAQCQQLAYGECPGESWLPWAKTEASTIWQCPAPAQQVVRHAPAGRGPVAAAYCSEHGGVERARQIVEASWLLQAPASVGDRSDVERAGARSLGSEHVYVVVRPCHPDQGEGWLVWLGIGSHMEAVGGAPPKRSRGGQVVTRMKRGRPVARGTHRWPTQGEALAAGRAAWARRVEADVARIRAARGGTLDWGLDVRPRDAPIELILPASHVLAWDAVATTPVVASAPTGEALSAAARELGRRGGLAGAGVSGARHRGGEALTPEQRALGQALGVVSRHAGAMEAAISRARAAGATDEQIERAISARGRG